MKVAYQIIADGQDVTDRFQDRLTSLTIVDEAGQKSDTATIVVDDRGNVVALPEAGARLEISMGFEGELVLMGIYIVDELSGGIAPDTITIKAKAADMLSGIRARTTRSWENMTVEDIVTTIADKHGLTPQISDSLKQHRYAFHAQTSESDLNFVTRLAKTLDAVAKPAGGSLLFVKRGESKAPDGSDLPVFTVHKTQMKGGSWTLKGRVKYGRVQAEWGDRGSATTRKVNAGTEGPQLTLRHRFPTEAEAQRAADAALEKSARASGAISIQLGGFWGDLMAEAKVDLQGIKPELTGEWLITRVQHSLNNSLVTTFEAERDNEEVQTNAST